jgi:hypothetical protein
METNLEKNKNQPLTVVISIVVILIVIWFYFGGGIEKQVASDEIKQYEMCLRNNDLIGACAHAGIISAVYQQAGDESGYRKWKSIEDNLMKQETDKSMNEINNSINNY